MMSDAFSVGKYYKLMFRVTFSSPAWMRFDPMLHPQLAPYMQCMKYEPGLPGAHVVLVWMHGWNFSGFLPQGDLYDSDWISQRL